MYYETRREYEEAKGVTIEEVPCHAFCKNLEMKYLTKDTWHNIPPFMKEDNPVGARDLVKDEYLQVRAKELEKLNPVYYYKEIDNDTKEVLCQVNYYLTNRDEEMWTLLYFYGKPQQITRCVKRID